MIVVFVWFAVAFALSAQEAVDRRYVHDRGGDVFVVPKAGLPSGKSSVVQRGGARAPVPDVALADVMADALGVTPLRVAESSSFFSKSQNAFHRSRVGVLLAVMGESSETLPLSAVKALHADVAVSSVLETSLAQDDMALLASVATGVPVKDHAVVAQAYASRDHALHTNPSRRFSSFADRLMSSGGSDVFVAASNSALTALLAPSNLAAGGTGVHALSWSTSQGRFVSHVPGVMPPVLDLLSLPELTKNLQLHWRGDVAVLEGADFLPRSNAHDALFLAELELLLSSAQSFLAARRTLSSPGFFGFVLSGLSGLTGAERVRAGRVATDKVLARALAALDQKEQASWQVLLVQQSAVVSALRHAEEAASSEIRGWALRAGSVGSVFASRPGACVHLAGSLWPVNLDALCPSDQAQQLQTRVVRSTLFANPPTPPPPSGDLSEVVAFQLVFWLVVALFLALLMGASTIASVDIPSDSPLIRNLPDIYKDSVSLRELM